MRAERTGERTFRLYRRVWWAPWRVQFLDVQWDGSTTPWIIPEGAPSFARQYRIFWGEVAVKVLLDREKREERRKLRNVFAPQWKDVSRQALPAAKVVVP